MPNSSKCALSRQNKLIIINFIIKYNLKNNYLSNYLDCNLYHHAFLNFQILRITDFVEKIASYRICTYSHVKVRAVNTVISTILYYTIRELLSIGLLMINFQSLWTLKKTSHAKLSKYLKNWIILKCVKNACIYDKIICKNM